MSRNLSKLLDIKSLKMLDHYAQYNPSPLSLQQFVEFGRTATEAESFHFLRKEMPVRLSNIMKEINLLPSSLLQMPSVQILQGWYADSFRELVQYEGRHPDPETLAEFVQSLVIIQDRCVDVVQTMAQGVLELKDSHHVDKQTETSIQYFLDRFYMSRISMRMLMNQHTLLFEPSAASDPHRVGIIDTSCNVVSVLSQAYEEASILCEKNYMFAPDIDIHVHNSVDDKDGEKKKKKKQKKPSLMMVYPPQHLKHILFELLKNSMRATVEGNHTLSVPSIDVLVAKGKKDVTIKISDQGGGIPHSVTDRIFRYFYSTAPRPSMKPTEVAAFAGYGYGLPLSRLYARYFHGDLILNSYEGYGTDAIIYLRGVASDANELLPIFNKTSTKQYKSAVPTADWTDAGSNMNSSFAYQIGASQFNPVR